MCVCADNCVVTWLEPVHVQACTLLVEFWAVCHTVVADMHQGLASEMPATFIDF